ncbi:MAG: 2-dehydro-3-deoxy-6-phosphogalactonate aldolase, partial [Alteromonadales bacterium]|nr:2-dehydro-3-deoxy-6-phosphogalactonate aldolase [Alteromonadales bacterium]
GLISMPGVATVSEAFLAYQSGARWLKLFPAASYGINHLKAMKSVMPEEVNFVAVGGIDSTNISSWLYAGVKAVGIGNSIFCEDDSYQQTKIKIEKFKNIFQ